MVKDNLEKRMNNVLELASKARPKDTRRASKYDHIDPEVVIGLKERGNNMQTIADIYGCNTKTLKYQMARQGYEFDGRDYYCRKDILIEDIIRMKRDGVSIARIARSYKTTIETIASRLRESGYKPRPRPRISRDDTLGIIESYSNNNSLAETSRQTGHSSQTVKKVLESVGVPIKSHKRADLNPQSVIKTYIETGSLQKTAAICGANCTTINIILADHHIKKRYANEPNRRKDLPTRKIISEYSRGKTTYEIARIYGCSPTTIATHLREAGVKINRGGMPVGRGMPIDEIRKKHGKGTSIHQLSIEYDCCWTTIKKIVKSTKS